MGVRRNMYGATFQGTTHCRAVGLDAVDQEQLPRPAAQGLLGGRHDRNQLRQQVDGAIRSRSTPAADEAPTSKQYKDPSAVSQRFPWAEAIR